MPRTPTQIPALPGPESSVDAAMRLSSLDDWNLLNAAQTIIPKLTKAMQREILCTYPMPATLADWRSFPALKRRGLIVSKQCAILELTPLGQKVRQVLQGRAGK